MVGRQVIVQNDGIPGRPNGSNESEMNFLQKEILMSLNTSQIRIGATFDRKNLNTQTTEAGKNDHFAFDC